MNLIKLIVYLYPIYIITKKTNYYTDYNYYSYYNNKTKYNNIKLFDKNSSNILTTLYKVSIIKQNSFICNITFYNSITTHILNRCIIRYFNMDINTNIHIINLGYFTITSIKNNYINIEEIIRFKKVKI